MLAWFGNTKGGNRTLQQKIFIFACIITLAPSLTAVRADSLNVELVGQFPAWSAYDVHVISNYAYLCAESALIVIDVSDPSDPIEVGRIDTPEFSRSVYVTGGYAYVADGTNGLHIIDVSDPEKPHEVYASDTSIGAIGIHVAGDYAYIAGGYGQGFYVIDVSDPTRPQESGICDTPKYINDVHVTDGYAYVSDGPDGIRIIDVAIPNNPYEVSIYDTPGHAFGAHVVSSYAYIADGTAGLQILDVADPKAPHGVGFCDTPGTAYRVHVSGSYAYIADGKNGLCVIDISDPKRPNEVGYNEIGFYDTPQHIRNKHGYTPGTAEGLYTVSGYIYLANGEGGLCILKYTGAPEYPEDEEPPDTNVPEVTQLLQNYPNPFSIETWIPYQLSESSEVAIRIYSVAGNMIQELNQDYKPAGFYIERDRAAYWDGRNEAGEPVASGVYVYVMQAGDFTDAKKLAVER